MGIKEILAKLNRKRDVFDELQRYDKADAMVQERKLSSEERALNKILEQQRQQIIKKRLQEHIKRDQHETWHKNVVHQPNIFKGHRSVLSGGRIGDNQKSIMRFE